MKNVNKRFAELDAARTVAILMMVVYHTAFDMYFFLGLDIDVNRGVWKFLARSTATTFLLLVGISFIISWERYWQNNPDFTSAAMKYVKRGAFVASCGMMVTLATAAIIPEYFVRFGILHMIGASILLLPLFRRLREFNAIAGIIVIFTGALIAESADLFQEILPGWLTGSKILLPLGIYPEDFATVDYFPLLPWFGIVLIGLALGDILYIRTKRKPVSVNIFWNALSFPGKHSLLIYMIHQPVILGLMGIL